MDFGGSNGSDNGGNPKVVNDEDLLLDNFYKKAGQTSAMGSDLGTVVMPPTPMTLPKQSQNHQEYISTHFKQQQLDQLQKMQRVVETIKASKTLPKPEPLK